MVFAVSAAFAFVMVVGAGEVGICCECSRGKVFRDFFNVSLRAADYADADAVSYTHLTLPTNSRV